MEAIATNDPAIKRQELLSDLFHSLNQPLTTLQCSLELALIQPCNAEQYQESLREALQQAENVSWLSTGIRELIEAGNPGVPQSIELDRALSEEIEDWAPVAESLGHRLSCKGTGRCSAFIDPIRLHKVLFYSLEWMLNSASEGAGIEADLAVQGNQVLLKINTSAGDVRPQDPVNQKALLRLEIASPGSHAQEIRQRLRIGLASSILAAAGGELRINNGIEHLLLELRFFCSERRIPMPNSRI